MKPRRARLLLACAALAVSGLGAGCGPADPLDRTIDAEDGQAFRRWTYRHRSRLGPVVERELHQALDQLKLRLQLERAGQPPDAINRAALAQLHGLTVREALTQSHIWSWRHLADQNQADDVLLAANGSYPLTPDADTAIVRRFREQLEAIQRRQQVRRDEMQQLEARLQALNPETDFSRVLGTTGAGAERAPDPLVF